MLAFATRPGGPRGLRRALLILAAAAAPTVAFAQQPAAASDELTQALLRYAFRYDGGNTRLIPGRVPDDLAVNFHAPAGTRVLGTVITNNSAVVLASTTTPPESLHAEYTRALGPRGWKAPQQLNRGGGFVGSPSERPVLLCRGDSQLHVQHSRRGTGTHDLYLEYRDGGSMCRASAEAVRFERFERPQFPTLYAPAAPPGTSMSRCHSRMDRRRMSSWTGTSTVVPTDLSAADLLRHYARQLEADGWRTPPPSIAPPVITGTWSRTDSTGTAQVSLEVSEAAPASGCYQVEMKLTR